MPLSAIKIIIEFERIELKTSLLNTIEISVSLKYPCKNLINSKVKQITFL